MCRHREGHDRGRRLVLVPPDPLELVTRRDLRRHPAVRVRRDGLPAEERAARAAHGRGVDVRGVRRDPGRTPPSRVRVEEGAAGGTAAGHGKRIPPLDRRPDGDQLRRRPRGLHRRGRWDALGIHQAVLGDGATRRGVREARAARGRHLEGQSAPRVRARPDGRGADGPVSGPAASRRPRIRSGPESRGDGEGGPPVRGYLLCPIASTSEEVVPGGPRDVPRPTGRGVRPTLVVRQEPRFRRLSVASDRGAPNGRHRPPAQAHVPGERDEDGAPDGTRRAHDPRRAHPGRGPEAERVPRVPGQGREGPTMKIGEIVAASVIDGLVAKLQLGNPEELKIAFPVIVEGARYDFYCLVEDVLNEESDIADQLAGSTIADVIVPRPETHEGDVGSVLIFDMHSEYGVFSATDKTEGLKFFFPGKVEIFSLDPKNREAKPFVLDTGEITPEDLIVALQDLTAPMVDTLYEIAKTRGGRDLISAVKDATMDMLGSERAHEMTLQGLKRRIGRVDRVPFLNATTPAKEDFVYILRALRDGESDVLDFGHYGTDQVVYRFVSNIP